MHVHRAQISRIFVAPKRFQQLFAAVNLAAIGDEQAQHIKFLGGEIDFLPAKRDRAQILIDAQFVHRQDIALLFFARRAHAAQDGLDTRLDFQNVERLGHIIVRAVFQAEDLIHIFALCGEHDDGHVGFLTDALTDFDPRPTGSDQRGCCGIFQALPPRRRRSVSRIRPVPVKI